jgi:hypothetical protein
MQMSSYEFTRECNMARNRVIGANLGFKTSIFGHAKGTKLKKPLKARNRSAGKVSYSNLRRSSRKPGQRVDKRQATETWATSGSVVEAPNPNPLQSTDVQLQSALPSVAETRTSSDPAQVPLATPASVELTNSSQTPATWPSPKPVLPINRSAWPEWLTEKYDHYAALEFGDKWMKCLYIWTEIERALKFHNPVSLVLVHFSFDDDETMSHQYLCSLVAFPKPTVQNKSQFGFRTGALLRQTASRLSRILKSSLLHPRNGGMPLILRGVFGSTATSRSVVLDHGTRSTNLVRTDSYRCCKF